MQALIVGCGYLGLRVAEKWRQQGHTVYAVTRSPERAAEFQQQGLHPLVTDICEIPAEMHWPSVDVLLFAVGFDRTAGRSQREVYVDGLRAILERVSARRVVYISSSSVYGQHEGEWVDEDSPTEPAQPGGQLCLEAEHLVAELCQSRQQSHSILRLSGIYGPDRLLSRITSLQQGEPLAGLPDAWLNLIHVADAAQAVIRLCDRDASARLYVVSDNLPVRRGDYYEELARLTGAPKPTFDSSQSPRRGAGGLNKRCRNTRLITELLPQLEFPDYRAGLVQALSHRSVD